MDDGGDDCITTGLYLTYKTVHLKMFRQGWRVGSADPLAEDSQHHQLMSHNCLLGDPMPLASIDTHGHKTAHRHTVKENPKSPKICFERAGHGSTHLYFQHSGSSRSQRVLRAAWSM